MSSTLALIWLLATMPPASPSTGGTADATPMASRTATPPNKASGRPLSGKSSAPKTAKRPAPTSLKKTRAPRPGRKPDVEAPAINIVVKGKVRRPAGDRTQDTTVVRGRKLRESAGASLVEVLARASGDIYVTSKGVGIHGVASGATGGIYVRGLGGFPNAQILIVEDGSPDFQGIFGHPVPDAYIPLLMDRVVVIKGGDSVLYGTNAMGAVIVITSRWKKREGVEIVAESEGGSYATVKTGLSLLSRQGLWDTAAAVHLFESEGHRPGAGGTRLVAQAATRVRPAESFSITLRGRAMHIEGADPGPVTHPTPDNWYDVWRFALSGQVRYAPGKVSVVFVPYLTAGQHKLYDGFLSRDTVAGAKVEGRAPVHRFLRLLGGISAEIVDGSVENRIDGTRQALTARTQASAYAEAVSNPLKSLRLVGGARLLYDEGEGPVFLYKGGVRWSLGRHVTAYTNITRNFRQPTLRDLYLPYPVANPDLKPEFSLNWSGSIAFTSRHVDATATVYRTSAQNLIKYFGSWPTAEVVNIDSYEVWGVEGKLRLKGIGPFSPYVMGNWQDVGRYTKQNPDAKLDFGVDFDHRHGRHRFRATLSAQYVHGLFMNNYSRDPMDDVFFLDCTVRYVLRTGRYTVEPYITARNLLDSRYAFVEYYTMPGFNFLAGVRLVL